MQKINDIPEEILNYLSVLFENNKIMKSFNLKETARKIPIGNPKVIRTNYGEVINGIRVEAIFETHLDTGEVYLKDAWVI